MVKSRAYGEGFNEKEQKAAWYTLHLVLKNLLRLFAPVTPYMTDYIWRELYGKESIHKESFPKPEWKFGLDKLTEAIMDFNMKIWKSKKDKGLSLKSEMKAKIPNNLKPFEKDLKKMHNLC